jgi:hypothetical protein
MGYPRTPELVVLYSSPRVACVGVEPPIHLRTTGAATVVLLLLRAYLRQASSILLQRANSTTF